MHKHLDMLTGVVVGSGIGVFYAVQLSEYLPLLVIAGVMLVLRLFPSK